MERRILTPSIKVTVRPVAQFRQVIGQTDIEMTLAEGSTVQQLLLAMAEQWGDAMKAYVSAASGPSSHPPLRVLVNGRDVGIARRDEVVLQDGDNLLMFTPVGGG